MKFASIPLSGCHTRTWKWLDKSSFISLDSCIFNFDVSHAFADYKGRTFQPDKWLHFSSHNILVALLFYRQALAIALQQIIQWYNSFCLRVMMSRFLWRLVKETQISNCKRSRKCHVFLENLSAVDVSSPSPPHAHFVLHPQDLFVATWFESIFLLLSLTIISKLNGSWLDSWMRHARSLISTISHKERAKTG